MSWPCADRTAHTLTRRDLLALTLALATSPLRAAEPAATSNADSELRVALDAMMPRQTPGAPRGAASASDRLSTLAGFRSESLSPSAAIDLQTVRAGLAIDQRIEALGADRTGSAYFALQLERCLGEAIAPQAAHLLLENEVRRLSQRAHTLLRELGYRGGDPGARFMAAANDSRWLYGDDASGRDRAVADMNWRLHTAKSQLVRYFANVPDFCLNVSVAHLSAAEEAAGRQGYRQLPTAQSAGAYVVDLRDIRRRPRWTLHSVVHHELLPGHLLQLPLETAASAHPLRLQYTPAFSEGWATYAEDLMAAAAFRGDAAAELGLMHWLLFRALRGVADTGLHHAGWSRARALQMLRQTQGLAAYFAPFEADVDRIIAEPGIRAAEALVWLRLRGLRTSTASRITPQEFHRRILQYGRQRIDAVATSMRAA